MMGAMQHPGLKKVPRVELANEDDNGVALSIQGPDGKNLTIQMASKDFARLRRMVQDFRRVDEDADQQIMDLPDTNCLWGERRKAG
jgi:hypothetical protein